MRDIHLAKNTDKRSPIAEIYPLRNCCMLVLTRGPGALQVEMHTIANLPCTYSSVINFMFAFQHF